MRKKILYELKSLYRDNLRIKGYIFGKGEKSACIVGAIRGNEVQQLYTCSQLVKTLKELEKNGQITEGKSVMVVPCVNSYSINIGKRFYPNDNTDINRMFPGYNLGETTQRIAAGLFNAISDYERGIQFASFYMPGEFIPHVRMMRTGYEKVEQSKEFGLPYVVIRDPKPYDTTTLNYNWQIWNGQSFSVYTSETDIIDGESAMLAVRAVLNYLDKEGIIQYQGHDGYISRVLNEKDMCYVKSGRAGIFEPYVKVNQSVKKGEVLALILDPYEGDVREKVTAPCDGTIFFAYKSPMTYNNSILFRIIEE